MLLLLPRARAMAEGVRWWVDRPAWKVHDSFIPMSVRGPGLLGLAEAVPWSTCHDDHRVDLLTTAQDLKSSVPTSKAEAAWPFMN